MLNSYIKLPEGLYTNAMEHVEVCKCYGTYYGNTMETSVIPQFQGNINEYFQTGYSQGTYCGT